MEMDRLTVGSRPPQAGRLPLAGKFSQSRQISLNQQIARDKWWLGGIMLERFVTRFFSDKLGLLPNWSNFLDYPILVIFAIYVLASVRNRPFSRTRTGFMPLTLALIAMLCISALANLDRLHPGAITLTTIGLLEPLMFMGLTYMLMPKHEVADFLVKLLFFIGLLQIVIVLLLDLPVFLATNNPDEISGTFGGNAYQMTFFLLAWNVLVLTRPAAERHKVLRLVGIALLQVLIIVIILLAQFRALIPFAAFTWMLTYLLVSNSPRTRVLTVGWGVTLVLALFFGVNALFPQLKYNDILQLGSRSEEAVQSGKVQSVLNFQKLLIDQPQVLALGTGPGTYASRGFQVFSPAGRRETPNQIYTQLFRTELYVTDVAALYTLPLANAFAFGSATLAAPWYSYLAIPAELGFIGFGLVLAIYFRAMWICWQTWKAHQQHSPTSVLALWVLVSMIVLLQMALLENWLEVSRVTVPIWLAFGVVLARCISNEDQSQSLKYGIDHPDVLGVWRTSRAGELSDR